MEARYTLKHYINGHWISKGDFIDRLSPANTQLVVAKFPIAPDELVEEAVSAATTAFAAFKNMPAPHRGELIYNLGELVRANKTFLANIVTEEIGKPIREALGSVQEVIDTCMYFCSEGRRFYGETVPSEMPNKKLFTYRKPIGVCGIVTAGNFPIAVPAWYIVPALLCGNTVVWKPSKEAPTTAYFFTKLIEKAGFPAGTVNLLLGNSRVGEAMLKLAEKGRIPKFGFTGSTAVGQRIGAIMGGALKRPCLELGGKNPMLVMADAYLEAAVEAAVFSAFGTAGQRCTSVGTLFVQDSIKSKFMSRFLEKTKSLVIGDPAKKETDIGPMISNDFLKDYEAYCSSEWIASHHKVLSVSKGRITQDNPWPTLNEANLETGLYAHPVVVDNVQPDDRLFMEETFGPVIGITEFKTIDDGIALANKSGFGLSSAIFTTNPKFAFAFQENINAGIVSINNSTIGAEAHLPFGGVGKSGNYARQSGKWVLDEFTYWQAVNWDYSNSLQKAQMDIADTHIDRGFLLSEET